MQPSNGFEAEAAWIGRASFRSLPKVDLHRHLEGSLRLETLMESAAEGSVRLAGFEPDSLSSVAQFGDSEPDFRAFLSRFEVLRQFYRTPEMIRRIAREAVLDAAADNVRYLELRFSPHSLAQARRFALDKVIEWVVDGVADARRQSDIDVRLLLTIVRGTDLRWAKRIVELAEAHRNAGVVGIDLAGDELSHPADSFAVAFRWARDRGLGTTVHAGEVADGQAIRVAIESLGAQRIGHGVRAADDEATIDLLRRSGVALEMCLTSNLQTGAVAGFDQHPMRDFHRAGLRVTVNTDNPSMSCTTLTDEYQIVANELGMAWSEIEAMILNGVSAAFLPDDEKRELEIWFRQALTLCSPADSAAVRQRSL